MALSGSIETMPLPDILQFLGLGRKTGILRLESGTLRKEIVVEDGRAVFCSSGTPKEYLGQHLLARTALTEADLQRAFATQRATGRRLGEVLVESGHVTAAELEQILHNKVQDAMYEAFTWPSGRFEFEEGARADDMPIRISLDWQDLVMEGARRSDEMGRIRALIPGPPVRFLSQWKSGPPGFPATPVDKKLLAFIDEGLSVGDMCARFHESDLDVLTRLKQLVEDGRIAVDPISLEEGRPLTRDDVTRRATELMERGDLVDAWETFREGARRFFDDNVLLAGLRTCETRLRRHYALTMSDLNAVPELRVTLDQLASHPLSSKQAYMVTRITGTWSVKSIVQLCPFEELEALTILSSLVRQGLVEIKAPAARY